MTSLQMLESLIRGGAVGALTGLAFALFRSAPPSKRVTSVSFCLAAAAHTLTQIPEFSAVLGLIWWPIWGLSVMGAGLFWAFAKDLFEDRSRPAAPRFIPAIALLVNGLIAVTLPANVAKWFWLMHNVAGGSLMLHVLFIIATDWKNDLVEPRRRLRGPILAATAAYALMIALAQSGELFWGSARALSPIAAVLLLAMSVVGIGVFLQADPELFGPARKPAEAVVRPAPELDGEDAAWAEGLERLMREERLYREEGLTIAALALKMRVPEYRLRRLINQLLGYRNFSAFLNQWRLEEAKQALADPSQAEVPISTIALDTDFQSLGPFNRAFKAETGMTPSQYREREAKLRHVTR